MVSFFVFGDRTGHIVVTILLQVQFNQIDPIIPCAKISLSVSVLDIFQAELFWVSCAG